jgi:dUTPase
VKNFIDVGAGVVDYDYRGNVGVVLFNHGEVDFAVARGDRVAQLVLERISMAGATEVQELAETSRGVGGFGSTGVAGGVAVAAAGEGGSPKRAKVEAGGVVMEVKKLTDLATIPVRGSEYAAGFDLSSAYDLVVPKQGKAIVKTDLAIAIPENTYARIGELDVSCDDMHTYRSLPCRSPSNSSLYR